MKKLNQKLSIHLLAGASFLIVCVGCASLTSYNAATGRSEFIFIPTSDEISMGTNLHNDLKKKHTMIEEGAQIERFASYWRTIGSCF